MYLKNYKYKIVYFMFYASSRQTHDTRAQFETTERFPSLLYCRPTVGISVRCSNWRNSAIEKKIENKKLSILTHSDIQTIFVFKSIFSSIINPLHGILRIKYLGVYLDEKPEKHVFIINLTELIVVRKYHIL